MQEKIEDKRDKVNFELRSLLSVISMIDGLDYEYENYQKENLTEEEFLEQQLVLITDAKVRLINIFKD